MATADPRKDHPTMPPPPPPSSLYKQRSWSPDVDREEAWQRRRDLYRSRRSCRVGGHHRLSRSVTDEDLEELRGCIELGFGFGLRPDGLDSPASSTTASSDEPDRLSDTLPALDLFYAVQRNHSSDSLAGSEEPSTASPRVGGGGGSGSPLSIYSPGDSPRQVKTRLKQWAQVVACSVRQHLP